MNRLTIAVDFDGTIVDHRFPDIGAEVPGAIDWMKRWQEAGARLILWTMRSDDPGDGRFVLTEAVEFCRAKGVEFWGVNSNPEQIGWTSSPKCYAVTYVDDAAFGCPLRVNPRHGGRAFVDWSIVGPRVLQMIQAAS